MKDGRLLARSATINGKVFKLVVLSVVDGCLTEVAPFVKETAATVFEPRPVSISTEDDGRITEFIIENS